MSFHKTTLKIHKKRHNVLGDNKWKQGQLCVFCCSPVIVHEDEYDLANKYVWKSTWTRRWNESPFFKPFLRSSKVVLTAKKLSLKLKIRFVNSEVVLRTQKSSKELKSCLRTSKVVFEAQKSYLKLKSYLRSRLRSLKVVLEAQKLS